MRLAQQRPASAVDNDLLKTVFGFFISVDEARDMMAIQRDRIVADYHRDADTTFDMGVAIFTPMNDGKYDGSMVKDGKL